MTSRELKNLIIEKIQKIDDKNLLESFDRFIKIESEAEELYQLNDKKREAIIEAENQIKNGDFLTNEEARKDIHSFLSEC